MPLVAFRGWQLKAMLAFLMGENMGSPHKASPLLFLLNCIQVQTLSYWGNCTNINQLGSNWRTVGLRAIQQNKVGNDWENGIALLNWNLNTFHNNYTALLSKKGGPKLILGWPLLPVKPQTSELSNSSCQKPGVPEPGIEPWFARITNGQELTPQRSRSLIGAKF